MSYHFNLLIPNHMMSGYRALAERMDTTVTDVFRRFADYCFREKVLNEIYPSCSGCIGVTLGKDGRR